MSQYLNTLCDALIAVLDGCAQLDRRRLAGYVANIDFWIGEIQHRLEVIDGFVGRRKRMIVGTTQVYDTDIRRSGPVAAHEIEVLVEPDGRDVSANWDELQEQSQELRNRVVKSATRFFRRCLQTGLLNSNQLFDIEDRLGIFLRGK